MSLKGGFDSEKGKMIVKMLMEDLTQAKTTEILVYMEQVARGAKPAADIGVWPAEDIDSVVESVMALIKDTPLRLYIQEYEDATGRYIALYLFKYSWVENLLEFLSSDKVDWSKWEAPFHVICGLLYGYGLVEIDEFLVKEKLMSRFSQSRESRVSEGEDYE